MSVWSWRATSEFLILDNMSAMGSVTITLPAGLLHTRDVAFQSELAEADAAEAELADVGARASTKAAAVAEAAWELGGLVEGLLVKRLSRHLVLYLASPGERHAQQLEQPLPLFVCLCGRADRYLHAANLVDFVVLDFREDDLLADAQAVVASAIKRVWRHALEIADARQRGVQRSVEELPHVVAAKRDHDADGHALAELEVRYRLFRPGDNWMLAGDCGDVGRSGVQRLCVLDGFAGADVECHLLHARRLHSVSVAKLFDESRYDLFPIAFFQPWRHNLS